MQPKGLFGAKSSGHAYNIHVNTEIKDEMCIYAGSL